MMRAVIVVLAAMALSGGLLAALGYVLASGGDTQMMLDASADRSAGRRVGEERARAIMDALERGHFRNIWIYGPGIALLVGGFVGLLVLRHAWQLAVVGAAPFAVAFTVGIRGVLAGLPFLCLYLAVAALGGWLGWMMRRVGSAQGT